MLMNDVTNWKQKDREGKEFKKHSNRIAISMPGSLNVKKISMLKHLLLGIVC